ncbi:MAG: Asp-tRNA(Asn)/Glu-tRNA(Gln) amidotransferase subunit GatC [Flavobacteriales bacterium]
MSKAITEETVEKLATLAKLQFTDEEKVNFVNDLNRIVGFVDKLQELNTDNVEPLIHMSDEVNVMREDDAEITITQQEALLNAPKKDSDYFKIPRVLSKK